MKSKRPSAGRMGLGRFKPIGEIIHGDTSYNRRKTSEEAREEIENSLEGLEFALRQSEYSALLASEKDERGYIFVIYLPPRHISVHSEKVCTAEAFMDNWDEKDRFIRDMLILDPEILGVPYHKGGNEELNIRLAFEMQDVSDDYFSYFCFVKEDGAKIYTPHRWDPKYKGNRVWEEVKTIVVPDSSLDINVREFIENKKRSIKQLFDSRK